MTGSRVRMRSSLTLPVRRMRVTGIDRSVEFLCSKILTPHKLEPPAFKPLERHIWRGSHSPSPTTRRNCLAYSTASSLEPAWTMAKPPTSSLNSVKGQSLLGLMLVTSSSRAPRSARARDRQPGWGRSLPFRSTAEARSRNPRPDGERGRAWPTRSLLPWTSPG